MNRFHPGLGVGIGLRNDFYDRFVDGCPHPVTWVEVISENYMDLPHQSLAAPLARLKKVREHCPIALHGVSLSIGSRGADDFDFLKRLKKLMNEIEALWVSDHLCWTTSRSHNLHDLYPLPYTEETLTHVVSHIHRIQDFLQRPLVIENASAYISYTESEMSEWDFIREMIKKTGAELLLDINNVYVNAFNFKFNPREYLEAIPHGSVRQIHLAGHRNRGTYLFDTHDDAICEDVWTLYEWYIKHYGFVPTMIERDDNIPDWSILEQELLSIEKMRRRYANDIPTHSATAIL